MAQSSPRTINVLVEKGTSRNNEYSFSGSFKIGRDIDCEVRLNDTKVSRIHAEVRFAEGSWRLVDLQSTNGVFVDGRRIDQFPLTDRVRVELGEGGPVLSFFLPDSRLEQRPQHRDLSMEHYLKHYFEERKGEDKSVGDHTMMIRTVYSQLQKKQRKRVYAIIGVLACLLICAGTYATYQHFEVNKQKVLAEDIFYTIKAQELEFADLLQAARQTKDAQSLEIIRRYQARRTELERKYDDFLKGLNIYGKDKSEEERLILSVARTFGECEVAMPAPFTQEILNYINKWKATQRLNKALELARKNGYISRIAEIMHDHGLPPQFMYLGLQESNFNVNACGPPTRFGIAKGMWQFIPTTARNYGLSTGPLLELQQVDPADERHDFLKSTKAAAEYLSYIYRTQAQASGLLVMASYNWGENRVIKLINTLPENPKERNFWCLLSKYRDSIPQETYDYVFYIVSAAVIGENPKLFGFDFDDPLKEHRRP